MMASVPMERSMYERELRGRRSCRIGRRNESVFPDPVWLWMKTSRSWVSSTSEESRGGSAARWIEVGAVMPILLLRCETMSGSRPSPAKVDRSVNGALLGFKAGWGRLELSSTSTLGLAVNKEETIWVDREGPATLERCSPSSRSRAGRGSSRGFFEGVVRSYRMGSTGLVSWLWLG